MEIERKLTIVGKNILIRKTNTVLKKMERDRKVYVDNYIGVDSCIIMVTKQLPKEEGNLAMIDLPGVITTLKILYITSSG